ncbi:exodeoxyribonuclease V subunit beta [Jatrophihabitans fulvus]
MTGPREFDLLGPLPTGTTVLEASAGTGKTFTIAGLVTRYVAEGVVRLDELLVVTFGRAATQELRDRVRARLVSARDALADPATAAAGDDALLRHLATADPREVAARRDRLVDALGAFDSATVATTHEFCRRVLAGLGTAADVDDDATFVDNLDDLTEEVVHDLYLRMWSRPSAGEPPLTVAGALELAHAVVRDGQAALVPRRAAPDSVADLRHRFAGAVRDEVERRKRARRLLTFDDLLTRLHRTLTVDATAGTAAARLRARYRVVLVDEFQDTDPVQWEILRAAFHEHAAMVLIGDPKQAIYAFRGADVHAYLAAAALARQHATLAHNWRSDPELLGGLDALFRGAALGDDRIRVHPVTAGHRGRTISGADAGPAPVEVRAVRSEPTWITPMREAVVTDLVARAVQLLSGDARLHPRDGGAPRPVRPGDIAVVVDTNAQLDLVHDALQAAGVPSVRRTTSSVFKTAAGTDWIVLLEALEQPQRTGRLRRLALTPFVGWTAADLDTGDVDGLGVRLRRWLRVYEQRGIAALLDAVGRDQAMPARLLGQLDGERRLTDIRHVGEALHSAATSGQLGLAALLDWLRRRVRESHRDTTVERSRRLDSDAAAVQIVTVWASKGLEFPVVFVPFEWDRFQRDDAVPLFHDTEGTEDTVDTEGRVGTVGTDGTGDGAGDGPERAPRRVRDVGGDGSDNPGFAESSGRARTELAGEHLRLLYVAMTRAQSLVIAWWAPSQKNSECAPLHRLLFTDDPAAGVPERATVPPMARAAQVLVSRAVPGLLHVTPASAADAAPPRWESDATAPGHLAAARLERSVDATWRRTSYSALTRAAHEVGPVIGSEPEVVEKDDEPDTPAAVEAGDDPLRAVPSPMAALPGGTGFGTLVHAVLEHADTTAADLAEEVRPLVVAQIERSGGHDLAADELTEALLPSIRTPLGPPAGDRSLAELPPADRLSELDFELPLCGGDTPRGRATLRDVAGLLREHLPPGDPLAGYPDLLDDPSLGDGVLRGYLGGSIDAVLRVRAARADRFVVVDYKTNRLGDLAEPLTAWHYRTGAMADAMMHAHYPLQALLYEVALHRFLRWRVRGYDPDVHLGGVLYLFLRGMCGPGVVDADGSIPGVFAWHPSAALVTATSDLLAGGVTP